MGPFLDGLVGWIPGSTPKRIRNGHINAIVTMPSAGKVQLNSLVNILRLLFLVISYFELYDFRQFSRKFNIKDQLKMEGFRVA